ncbi:hypothetical protein H823_YJM1447K00114 [Saccharomyces cerevisiae YJM1447]|nr:hypothetical protein H823_YJM1447K00114 [Saccharomyces cerevisiae YJM1447]
MPFPSILHLIIGRYASYDSNNHMRRRAKLMEAIFRIRTI